MKYRAFAERSLFIGAFVLVLSACGSSGSGTRASSNVDGSDGFNEEGNFVGGGSNSESGFPNNGSIGGTIIQGIKPIAGNQTSPEKGFVCQQSTSFDAGAFIDIGANGLVGGLLGNLLGLLPGDGLNNLLNGISDSVLALDSDLRTAAVVTQALAGLGGILNSMDVIVNLPDGQVMPAGNYAVFAVSFPPSLLELGLQTTLSVQTLLGDVVQESGAQLNTNSLSILGLSPNQPNAKSRYALVGFKTVKPYNRAQLSISAGLLSLDVGEKLYIHEFCTAGDVIDPPA